MKHTTLIVVPSMIAILCGSACGGESNDSEKLASTGGASASPGGSSAGGEGQGGGGGSSTGGASTGGSASGGEGGGGVATGGRGTGGSAGGPDGGTGGASLPDAEAPDAAPLVCTSDNDCTPSGRLCSPTTQTCVRCYEEAHCPNGQTCEDGACRRFTTCASSLDCAGAADGRTICDPETDRCVECATTADCGGTGACVLGRCECADLLNDPDNCGSCGHECGEGIPCTGGECKGWTACLTRDDVVPGYTCNARCAEFGATCATDCGPSEGALLLGCVEPGLPNFGPLEGSECGGPIVFTNRSCCCESNP